MARLARQLSESGLYHIVFRGINRQHIFEEESDYVKLKTILGDLKEEHHFEIYAYCFMSNHVHLLLKEAKAGDISLIMKRLLTRYVMYYNKKYKRSGSLIANRYKSQAIEIDEYFLSVVRYIHQNPTKAKIAEKTEEYPWSSYKEYVKGEEGIADKKFLLEMLPLDEMIVFHQRDEEEIFTVSDSFRKSDEVIYREIKKRYKMEPKSIGEMTKTERNAILKELKECYSIRQIERVTGISRGIVAKS